MDISKLEIALQTCRSLYGDLGNKKKLADFNEMLLKLSLTSSTPYLRTLAKKIALKPSKQLMKDTFLALERHHNCGGSQPVNQRDGKLGLEVKSELIIALENIRSAANVGAILRSGSFFGVKEFIGIGYTPSPQHPKVVKVAMSSYGDENQQLPWHHFATGADFLSTISTRCPEHKVIAVETTSGATEVEKFLFPKKSILIFGNEVHGLNQTTLEYADSSIAIKANGYKNSLNVATCMGICTYAYNAILKSQV